MRRSIPTAVTTMFYLQALLDHRWMLVVLLLAVLPFSLHGAWQSWKSIENDPADWLPAEFEATEQLTEFVALYGSDELLMISWEGCTLSDERLAAYADRLQQPANSGDVLFRKVITGPAVLESFESDPLNMTHDEAVERMSGWIVSPDGDQTCVIALVSAAGAANRHEAIDHATGAANLVEGLTAESIRMAGPTIDKVAIDRASASNLVELNLLSFAVCLAIMAACLRNLRAALLVFSIALFNEQLSMALIYYCGTQMDSILLLTANLTFVLSISIGIHLVNYYRDTLQTTSVEEAPARALYVAFRPTAIATVTTALGLASLGISEIVPLKRFGVYSAASVLLASVTTALLIAVHFRIWPLATRVQGSDDEDRLIAHTTRLPWLGYLCHFRVQIVLATVVALVVGAFGVQRLETLVGLQQMISPDSRAISDYRWLEQRIGPLIPIEVVLAMKASDDRGLVNEFRTVSQLHKNMQAVDPSFAVISVATFAAEPPKRRGGVRQIGRATVFRRKLFNSQEELNELGYLRSVGETNYWRLTLRAPAVGDVDYGRLVSQLRTVVDSTVANETNAKPEDVIICGGIPLVHQAQQQLLDDLINSFALAFGLVGAALAILFRSLWCGLICMIPNVLPSALVFGAMGWLEIPVEIGGILTACAAFGIAVDDSMHFITWFQRRVSSGGTIAESVAYAYRHCAAAMVQTTLICGLGLLVFAGSEFTPMIRFGWCMFLLLSTALVADLIILPTLLLSPLGRPFLPKQSPSPAQNESPMLVNPHETTQKRTIPSC